jgi:hypothetical protein
VFRKSFAIVLVVGLLFALTAVASASWRPTVTAPQISGAGLELDGLLQEQLWVKASLANSKVVVDLMYSNDYITKETSVAYIAYDAENLYVAAVNYDSTPGLDKAAANWGTSPGMEIDFKTKASAPYTVIHIFPNGTARFDQGGVAGANEMLKVGTSIFSLGWIMEVVIPFQALGIETPAEGTSWEFQIGGQSDQWKAWKSTGGSNYTVENAGTLIFGGEYR